jgi:glutaredoxin
MKIEIYGKPNCVFCTRAIRACEANDLEYTYTDISKNAFEKSVLESRMPEPLRTVPQIFVDGEFIPGGFTGFASWLQERQ